MSYKSMKVLFIEDEHELQAILKKSFEEEGYAFLQAYDGERGLQTALEGKPNIILLDLVLPKKDGFSVLKNLKENPNTKDIPVMILTNLEQEKDIEKSLSLGALTYLIKINYTPQEIVQKVSKVLTRRIGKIYTKDSSR